MGLAGETKLRIVVDWKVWFNTSPDLWFALAARMLIR
jgi:hypothetical protein